MVNPFEALGYVLQSAADPLHTQKIMQQRFENQQQRELGKLKQREFAMREEELAMRQAERARQIKEAQALRDRQNQARQALGGLSGLYAERTGIPAEQARSLIESGAIGSEQVLGSLQVDPVKQLQLEEARLRLGQLQAQQNAPGINDLMAMQQPQTRAAPQIQTQDMGTYTKIDFGSDTATQDPYSREKLIAEQKQGLDQMYDAALSVPNFNPAELKRLEKMRENTTQQYQRAQEDVQNFETLKATRQEITENLLEDIRVAKAYLSGEGQTVAGALAPTRLLPGSRTSGIEGYLASFAPGTTAFNLNESLERIRAFGALNTLEEAKKQSSSGATGFGALSEKELALIINSLANLEIGQSDEQLLRNIEDVERMLLRQVEKIDQGLAEFGVQPEAGGGQESAALVFNPQTGRLE